MCMWGAGREGGQCWEQCGGERWGEEKAGKPVGPGVLGGDVGGIRLGRVFPGGRGGWEDWGECRLRHFVRGQVRDGGCWGCW